MKIYKGHSAKILDHDNQSYNWLEMENGNQNEMIRNIVASILLYPEMDCVGLDSSFTHIYQDKLLIDNENIIGKSNGQK